MTAICSICYGSGYDQLGRVCPFADVHRAAAKHPSFQGQAMPPYQQRVVDERNDLDTKISALRTFIGSAMFPTVPLAERLRLGRQLVAMNAYSEVLNERILAFIDPQGE